MVHRTAPRCEPGRMSDRFVLPFRAFECDRLSLSSVVRVVRRRLAVLLLQEVHTLCTILEKLAPFLVGAKGCDRLLPQVSLIDQERAR
eukprot:1809087-Pleurochrysis_carterae.AAC.2